MGTTEQQAVGATLAETARHLSMAREGVRRLVAAGVLQRHPDGTFDLAVCRVAYIEHLRAQAAGAAKRDRLAEVRARMLEQRIARESASSMSLQEGFAVVNITAGKTVQVLESLPARLHPHNLSERKRAEALIFVARGEIADLVRQAHDQLEAEAQKHAKRR